MTSVFSFLAPLCPKNAFLGPDPPKKGSKKMSKIKISFQPIFSHYKRTYEYVIVFFIFGPQVAKIGTFSLQNFRSGGWNLNFWAKRLRIGIIIWVLRIFLYKIIFFGVYSKNGETDILKFFLEAPTKIGLIGPPPGPPGGPKLIFWVGLCFYCRKQAKNRHNFAFRALSRNIRTF